jgi:glycerol-1-phosphate dehydrogenase [NAD(P)+]
MNSEELLDKTFDCECGRTHNVPIKKLIYSEDAFEYLPKIMNSFVDGRRIALVADQRTYEIAGRQAHESLEKSGWSVYVIIVPDSSHGTPACNETTHNWLNERFPPSDIALAVGSGVINDLTKWSAFEHNMPYVVLATAATMNGYTAANVAPAIKGVKTLIVARPPLAVLAVPSIIVNAPFELTVAGLGDVIAKPVSTADWLFNHICCDEHFCRYCSEIINSLEKYYFSRPKDIKARKAAALENLFNTLLYSGIAMTIIGTSAPASGGEHLLSHTLDMMSCVDGVAHDLHGRQVGIGAIFSAAIYERILRIETPNSATFPPDLDNTFWGGQLADNVRRQYDQKKSVLETLHDKLTDAKTWKTFIDAARRQVRSPQQIKNCLKTAGAAHTFSDIGCTRERFLNAVLHMHEIRKRPTIIDLAWILGILPISAEQIIDKWLTT